MTDTDDALGDNESQPLLRPGRPRQNSVTSILARGRSNTISGLKTGYDTVKRHRVQFMYALMASVLLYVGFTLAFLPRTSLSRDFRRLHFGKLTHAETYRIFLESLQGENHAQQHLRAYTSERHLAGDENALKYTVDQLKKLGFSPKLEKYYPWLNTPVDAGMSLWINDEMTFESNMIEDFLKEDPSSSGPNPVPAFHGYSANGDITARFVYCNYGKLEDYEYLKSRGVDLEGHIHVIRYDTMFRGLKVKNAESNGASAVILYTDTFDDGNVTESNGFKAYPFGPARNPSGFQRGSVEYFTESPGDPTTPGFASKSPNTKRMSPLGRVPGIPSIPMSQRDIGKILPHLNSRGCAFDVQGNVEGFEYYSGPSDEQVKVRVFNKQDYGVKEITDVFVEIPGILHGSTIIIGNHRDSWTVGGAGDPNSGSSVLLEVARGLSELVKKGWKPLRTIQLVSWDGEEPAMLGSTEYGENYAAKLQRQVLAYFNLDTTIAGSQFKCESNPLLAQLLIESASLTRFAGNPGQSLLDVWNDQSNAQIGILGSGTDFAVFQNHLGIPSANFKFVADRKHDAVYQYHTNYDTYTWMEKFVDPDYHLHNTMAIFTGMSALTLSENELVAFQSHDYVKQIQYNYAKWHGLLNQTFRAGVYLRDSYIQEKAQDLSQLIAHVEGKVSPKFDSETAALRKLVTRDYPWYKFPKKIAIYFKLSATNSKLKQLDRLFVTDRGLKDRGWMKHSIFGPDKQLGYLGDVLPGLHEAVSDGNVQETLEWLHILTKQMKLVQELLET
ncbi:LANO_0B01464g1_1 [Lachancea nothofagi CBS 11611]|uniref:LANO_0B01464g1_1 n=1 Tax=Lachancea nothofagi CBS 11611 TaxID=1266666 RepID=A0A1G4IVA4_9SACH|nr:LANO_0B01464g1_1 [Lachancea nothofagi CBS 11611]